VVRGFREANLKSREDPWLNIRIDGKEAGSTARKISTPSAAPDELGYSKNPRLQISSRDK